MKFKETCGQCSHSRTQRVGDSFDRAEKWMCFYNPEKSKVVNSYRDEKDGAPEIPKWCPLPDYKKDKE